MTGIRPNSSREILAIKVRQWLEEWDSVDFSPDARRRRPDPHFYVFSLPASELKALSGIYRRDRGQDSLPGSQNLGIQRRHDPSRSKEIREFVQHGFPWSGLPPRKRESGQYDDLRKPGWLPTAIVVNVLRAGDKRLGIEVANEDLITLNDPGGGSATFVMPEGFAGPDWSPRQTPPIEVIDGQHRLWAFDEDGVGRDYELPVVAYHGLDISWQAYLFWTINLRPKRINASLAFDLYPLLRTEDWLEKFEGHSIYRETRAQELTENLWGHPDSVWHHRINMLGEPGLRQPMATQAAWIRSLLATYVKRWEGGRRSRIGGLFGAQTGQNNEALPWTRAQQAAFLVLMGQEVRDAVAECTEPWARALRERGERSALGDEQDPAFYGTQTLLTTDQGIRGVLYATNDLCYVRAEDLRLGVWRAAEDAGSTDDEILKAITAEIGGLRGQPVSKFLKDIARSLATYDWRTSAFPGLTESQRLAKAALRGSGGYRELRVQLLQHLGREYGAVGDAAGHAESILGYA